MRPRRCAPFALVVPWFLGCTLAADGASLSEGCPEGTKECDGSCVSTNDDLFGCGRASCSPCSLHKSVNACSAEGECVIASCVGAWEDCDRNPQNGCEVNLDTNRAHCGGCGEECEPPENGLAACAEAQCYVRTCEGNYFDCNFDFRDGCEVDLHTDKEHCGECENACPDGEECMDAICEATE